MKQTIPIAALLALAACSTGAADQPLIVPASVAGTSAETEWRELAREEQQLIERVRQAREDLDDSEGDLRKARTRLDRAREDLVAARAAYAIYRNAPPPMGDPETVAAEQRKRAKAAEDVSDAQRTLDDRSRRVDSASRDLRDARQRLEGVERQLETTSERRRRLETGGY